MVIGGRGRPEDMEAYDEMQNLYSKSNDFERYLSRSFLLEHGVHATNIIKEVNQENGYAPTATNGSGNNKKQA
jgi:hypothetical protein